jgi:hypothetical protein
VPLEMCAEELKAIREWIKNDKNDERICEEKRKSLFNGRNGLLTDFKI